MGVPVRPRLAVQKIARTSGDFCVLGSRVSVPGSGLLNKRSGVLSRWPPAAFLSVFPKFRCKGTAFLCKNTAQQRQKCNLVFFYFLVQELSQVIHIGQGLAELIRHILCRGIGSYSHRALEILNNKFYKILIR